MFSNPKSPVLYYELQLYINLIFRRGVRAGNFQPDRPHSQLGQADECELGSIFNPGIKKHNSSTSTTAVTEDPQEEEEEEEGEGEGEM